MNLYRSITFSLPVIACHVTNCEKIGGNNCDTSIFPLCVISSLYNDKNMRLFAVVSCRIFYFEFDIFFFSKGLVIYGMCTQFPCCSAVFIVNDNLGWASKVGVAVTCECDLHHGLILALALGCKPPPPQTTPPPPSKKRLFSNKSN